MLLDSLIEIGLNKYESLAYIALLSHGITDARNISDISQVPFGRIYDVLGSLEDKGIVEKQATRPMKYLAIDPKIAISRLITMKESEMDRLKEKSQNIEYELIKIKNNLPDISAFWKVAVNTEALIYYNEKILEAKEFIDVYTEFVTMDPRNAIEHTRIFLNNLKLLQMGQIKIRIIVGILSLDQKEELIRIFEPLLPQIQQFEIKFSNTITIPFIIFDKEHVLLKIHNPIEEKEYLASIYLRQPDLAEQLQKKFDILWIHGILLQDFLKT